MTTNKPAILRDVLIKQIYSKMKEDPKIFFISADFGAPMLDDLRKDFPERFINVGIAEQNLINVSVGLALEGNTVYAYGIAPFLAMRAYEQIRINLAMLSELREVNVNLIGVGAGLSYDVSGPTHHCLEDLGIIRMLPNVALISPSDEIIMEKLFDYTLYNKKPKYIRLDGKPLPQIYKSHQEIDVKKGFYELSSGKDICIIATGYMTQKALSVKESLNENGLTIGVIDVFMLKPIDEKLFREALQKYKFIITLEEAFVHKGGLDGMLAGVLEKDLFLKKIKNFGFKDSYVFEIGDRENLHRLQGLSKEDIISGINEMIKDEK